VCVFVTGATGFVMGALTRLVVSNALLRLTGRFSPEIARDRRIGRWRHVLGERCEGPRRARTHPRSLRDGTRDTFGRVNATMRAGRDEGAAKKGGLDAP